MSFEGDRIQRPRTVFLGFRSAVGEKWIRWLPSELDTLWESGRGWICPFLIWQLSLRVSSMSSEIKRSDNRKDRRTVTHKALLKVWLRGFRVRMRNLKIKNDANVTLTVLYWALRLPSESRRFIYENGWSSEEVRDDRVLPRVLKQSASFIAPKNFSHLEWVRVGFRIVSARSKVFRTGFLLSTLSWIFEITFKTVECFKESPVLKFSFI